MPSLVVAHIHEQGQDMIIALVNSSFGSLSETEQRNAISEIQLAATSARLAGLVVPIWESMGQTHFVAPPQWHPFFRSISYDFAVAIAKKVLSW